jgi:branched-chain amino acid aminotransferase
VAERRISIDELLKAGETGRLQEVFGSGTAAVVSPVGQIKYGDRAVSVGSGQVGPLAKRFYTAITDIQYGRAADPKDWVVSIDSVRNCIECRQEHLIMLLTRKSL